MYDKTPVFVAKSYDNEGNVWVTISDDLDCLPPHACRVYRQQLLSESMPWWHRGWEDAGYVVNIQVGDYYYETG